MLTVTIGEKIKQLRKKNDVTQEKLADYLHISYQAVSKWENNTASPDISMIVPIANFFDVPIDILFDRDSKQQEKEIEEIKKEGVRLGNLGLVTDRIQHWRYAVSKYPKNFDCIMNLAYALFSAHNTGIFQKEDDDKNICETIKLCEQTLEDCTDNTWRFGAMQLLVLIYGESGSTFHNEEKAVKYACDAPNICYSQELLLKHAYGYRSEKGKEQIHRNIIKFTDLLTQDILLGEYNTEEQIAALKTAAAIWNAVFTDGNFLFYHCRLSEIYRNLAINYAKQSDENGVIDSLEKAKRHALAYMNIPDGTQHYTGIYVCKATHDKSCTSKNFSETELDLISDILSKSVFDFMRNSERFIDFEKDLYTKTDA